MGMIIYQPSQYADSVIPWHLLLQKARDGENYRTILSEQMKQYYLLLLEMAITHTKRDEHLIPIPFELVHLLIGYHFQSIQCRNGLQKIKLR